MVFSLKIKEKKRFFRLFDGKRRLFALCFTAAIFFSIVPARAEETHEPLVIEDKKWVDLDSYEEAGADSSVSLPALPDEPAPNPAPNKEKIAAPVRPLDLPSLPAMAPVEALDAPSTEEENKAFFANKDKWRQIQDEQEEELEEDVDSSASGKKGLSIRFATLPSPDVKSIPDERISKPVLDRQKLLGDADAAAKKKKASKTKQQKEKEAQACEALNDYRRRQLEAIESDRQTLSALRKALSELGLVDRLKFMANGESVPKMESGDISTPEASGAGDLVATP